MTLGTSRSRISRIIGFFSLQKTIYKLTFFDMIETKPVDIVLDKNIDKIKEINRKYVMI